MGAEGDGVAGHQGPAGHEGYVAGRQSDGGLSDIWTDVRANAEGRYLAYVPRCECGWTGPPFSTTLRGYAACERLWRSKHLESFLRAREPRCSRPRTTWIPRVIHGDSALGAGSPSVSGPRWPWAPTSPWAVPQASPGVAWRLGLWRLLSSRPDHRAVAVSAVLQLRFVTILRGSGTSLPDSSTPRSRRVEVNRPG